jgi:hypothetical protein
MNESDYVEQLIHKSLLDAAPYICSYHLVIQGTTLGTVEVQSHKHLVDS